MFALGLRKIFGLPRCLRLSLDIEHLFDKMCTRHEHLFDQGFCHNRFVQ